MGNPAEASARADAERRGCVMGTEADILESELIPATADDPLCGAWLVGERPPAALLPTNPLDLLTDEDKRRLWDDLGEIARVRRSAEASAANWPMP